MSRLVLLTAASLLAATPALAQRLEVDAARKTSYEAAISTRGGETIASELSDSDGSPFPGWRAEHFIFSGRAGETVEAQVQTEIPGLVVVFLENKRREIARGPAKDAPLKIVLPRDGTYFIVVGAKGPQRNGKYLLSLRTGEAPAPAEPPKPAPVAVAATQPQAPTPRSAPLSVPELPAIPGVVNIRTGETLARPAGKPGAAIETFQFIAGTGAKLQATATGFGPLTVRLYTPEGALMLAADGVGTAKLEAFLPLDALYFLSVARSDPAKPYKLALAAEEATLLDADFLHRVGYDRLDEQGRSQGAYCWVEPGVRSRLLTSNFLMTLTRLGGGRGRADFVAEGKPLSYTWETRIEGEELVQMTSVARRYTPFSMDGLGPYRGYFCQ